MSIDNGCSLLSIHGGIVMGDLYIWDPQKPIASSIDVNAYIYLNRENPNGGIYVINGKY